MISIKIVNHVNGREYGAMFETQAELDAWRDKHIAKNTWGLPERWIRPFVTNVDPDAPTFAEPEEGYIDSREYEYRSAIDAKPERDVIQFNPETNEEETVTLPAEPAKPAIMATEYLYPAQYTISDDRERLAQINLRKVRQQRDILLSEVDKEINKHVDEDPNAIGVFAELKAYRIALRDCTDSLKKLDGNPKITTAEVDPDSFSFPAKPF